MNKSLSIGIVVLFTLLFLKSEFLADSEPLFNPLSPGSSRALILILTARVIFIGARSIFYSEIIQNSQNFKNFKELYGF